MGRHAPGGLLLELAHFVHGVKKPAFRVQGEKAEPVEDYLPDWDQNTELHFRSVITADIVLVGILGAWAIIVGVQLVIAAITLRTPRPAVTEAAS